MQLVDMTSSPKRSGVARSFYSASSCSCCSIMPDLSCSKPA